MIEDPKANIEVRLEIPASNYIAHARMIMSQYSEVVKNAMQEIQEDLMFNNAFQEEVKNAVKSRLYDAVQMAIKSAAEKVVWQTFMDRKADENIEKVISDSIMEALKGSGGNNNPPGELEG